MPFPVHLVCPHHRPSSVRAHLPPPLPQGVGGPGEPPLPNVQGSGGLIVYFMPLCDDLYLLWLDCLFYAAMWRFVFIVIHIYIYIFTIEVGGDDLCIGWPKTALWFALKKNSSSFLCWATVLGSPFQGWVVSLAGVVQGLLFIALCDGHVRVRVGIAPRKMMGLAHLI
jgi:hypothetical protein